MRLKLIARIVLPLAIVATALASPAISQAGLYCVNKSPCLGGTPAADPQVALALAELNPGPDTVSIGPKPTAYVGPFSYAGPDPVAIVGAGTAPGETILTAPGPAPTLELQHAGSTVSNLRIEVEIGPSIGLALDGTATGVRIQERDDGQDIGPATGVLLKAGAVLEQSTVVMDGGLGVVSTDPNISAFVVGSTIRSRQGVGIMATGKLHVAQSTVESLGSGIHVTGAAGDALLAETVVRTEIGPALRADSGATTTALHMTLLSDGAAPRGIEVIAGLPGTGGATYLTLTSSIVSGFPQTLFRQGIDPAKPGNAILRYSAWDGDLVETGSGTIDAGAGNLPDTTPLFVQRLSAPPTVQADLRLLAPSPLIDGAKLSDSPVDHDGAPRNQDGDGDGVGRSDIGAFEYAPHAPSAPTIAPVLGATVGAPVQFAASGADDPDPGERAQLTYSWDFGDGGTATGATPSHTFGAAGVRTVTVTVTDPSRRSAAAMTSVDVRVAPGTGGGAAAQDRIAPRLSDVSLSSRRLQLGGTLPKLVKGAGGTQIRFTLSEPATVTLRFAAIARGASKPKPRVLVVVGKAGPNRLRFAGRISAAESLSAGRHKLTVSAVDAAGNRAPARVVRRFELLPAG